MRPVLLSTVFLGICAPLKAMTPPVMALSSATAAELSRIEADMSLSLTGRRLLAQTYGLARREAPQLAGDSGLRYVAGLGVLAFDPKRLGSPMRRAAELALARELARAGADLPIELIEGDAAAYQTVLEFALERADADQAFSTRLKESLGRMKGRGEAPELSDDLPRDELERVAYFLILFRRDPDRFYRAVERGLSWSPQAVGLTELEDFLEKYRDSGLGPGSSEAGALYVRLKGRRYRSALVDAARVLQRTGGSARLREALGPFDSSSAALRSRVDAWLRTHESSP